MAAPSSPQAEAESLSARMTTMSLDASEAEAPKPQPQQYLKLLSAAFHALNRMKKVPFQSKTDWPGSKNAGTAASRKWHANKVLKKSRKGANRNALMLLTQCIGATPYPNAETGVSGQELAAAFAARAAYFLEAQAIPECLSDLEHARAVYPDAPETVRAQWDARQAEAEARKQMKDGSEGNATLGSSLQLLATLTPPVASFPKHASLDGATDVLEVRRDPVDVSMIVASADIRIGDVIHIETAYASILAAECFISHCFHCLTPHDDMIPCQTCSMVQYCGEVCRSADASLFHQWECPLLGTLVQTLGPDECWLPLLMLRMLMVAVHSNRGLDPLLQFIAFMDSQGFETSRGFDREGRYQLPNGYPSMHYATRGSDVPPELAHFAALILMGLDNLTDFFIRYPASLKNKMLVGALLLRYGVIARMLGHHVDSVSPPQNGRWSTYLLASAIYPTAGLGRHSCCPNTIRAFRGDTLVLMACENIAKGEQVTTSYGMHYLANDLSTRQSQFDNYMRECNCEACLNQWPTLEALNRLQPTYQCLHCHAELPFRLGDTATDVLTVCTACRKPNNILTYKIEEQEVKALLASIKNRQTQMNDSPAIFSTVLINALAKLRAFLRPPDARLAAVLTALQDSIRHGGQGNLPRPSKNKARPAENKSLPSADKFLSPPDKPRPSENKSLLSAVKSLPIPDKACLSDNKSLPSAYKSSLSDNKSLPSAVKSFPIPDKASPLVSPVVQLSGDEAAVKADEATSAKEQGEAEVLEPKGQNLEEVPVVKGKVPVEDANNNAGDGDGNSRR